MTSSSPAPDSSLSSPPPPSMSSTATDTPTTTSSSTAAASPAGGSHKNHHHQQQITHDASLSSSSSSSSQTTSSTSAPPPRYHLRLSLETLHPKTTQISSHKHRVKELPLINVDAGDAAAPLGGENDHHNDHQQVQEEASTSSADSQQHHDQNAADSASPQPNSLHYNNLHLLIDSPHSKHIPIHLKNISVPQLIKHNKMARYLPHADMNAENQYGIVKLQVQNVFPLREKFHIEFSLSNLKVQQKSQHYSGPNSQSSLVPPLPAGNVATTASPLNPLHSLSIRVERRKLIGESDESWISAASDAGSQQQQMYLPSEKTLKLTRLIDDSKARHEEQIRFQVERNGELLGTISKCATNGSTLHWKDLREGLSLELTDELKQALNLSSEGKLMLRRVHKEDVKPFTRFFQSGARLNLSFSVDCSVQSGISSRHRSISNSTLEPYEKVINEILRQFAPYSTAEDQVVVNAFGVEHHKVLQVGETMVEEKDPTRVKLDINSQYDATTGEKPPRSADWRTFSHTLQQVVNESREAAGSSSLQAYNVHFVLTRGGESRLRKAYSQLARASRLPLSVIFIGMDEEAASECQILQQACMEGSRMTEDGQFPLKRNFCACFPFIRSKQEAQLTEDSPSVHAAVLELQQNLFYSVLAHIEDYMDVFHLDLKPKSYQQEFNKHVDELKRCLRLVKPKPKPTPPPPPSKPAASSDGVESTAGMKEASQQQHSASAETSSFNNAQQQQSFGAMFQMQYHHPSQQGAPLHPPMPHHQMMGPPPGFFPVQQNGWTSGAPPPPPNGQPMMPNFQQVPPPPHHHSQMAMPHHHHPPPPHAMHPSDGGFSHAPPPSLNSAPQQQQQQQPPQQGGGNFFPFHSQMHGMMPSYQQDQQQHNAPPMHQQQHPQQYYQQYHQGGTQFGYSQQQDNSSAGQRESQ